MCLQFDVWGFMKVFSPKHNAKKSRTISAALGIAVFASSLFATSFAARAETLDTALNEQVVMVPAHSGASNLQLETTIFKPPGNGPFPLVIMNHGKALGDPRNQSRDRFIIVSREFVKRGYAVVIPMRKGFSKSTGEYIEYGCNMTAHGQEQADDLQSTLEYLRTQPWADSQRVVVAGQSYGGLTAMAFGTRHFPGVKGLINFAGGLKVHGGNCRWQDSLVQAFSTFGADTGGSLPSLWFYGENDHHFGPQLAARLRDAYVRAGGNAKLITYGPFRKDAHGMVATRDGVKIWWPETEKFLRELGMPTETVLALEDDVTIPEVQYAAIDNVEAIPYLHESGRQQYRAFLNKSMPRAFAVSSTGAWSWAEEGDDPVATALADCRKHSNAPCKLYAVDNQVVWSEAPTDTMMATAPVDVSIAAPESVVQPESAPAVAGDMTGR